MGVPHLAQVRDQSTQARAGLSPWIPAEAWSPDVSGPESHFRNKAKLAVSGDRDQPTFGLVDPRTGRGVDLVDCGLYEPALAAALPRLAEAVAGIGLVPYDIPRRSGEFKHLIVTASPTGQIMARFVLRSPGQIPRIRRSLPDLVAAVPGLRVVSVNLQPEHKAILEGPEEVLMTEEDALAIPVGDLTLWLRPSSFFQTNTAVAGALYAQAAEWIAELDPSSVLDLYCGVGGFALTAARAARPNGAARAVHGIEISPQAISSAERTARDAGLAATFEAGDATGAEWDAPDLVIVNPPRRGLGPRLTARLADQSPPSILYSSCHPASLARDLAALPGHRVQAARFFDMFPQTHHHEVAVLLERV